MDYVTADTSYTCGPTVCCKNAVQGRVSTSAADCTTLYKFKLVSLRRASANPFSGMSQVMVEPEIIIRAIYRMGIFRNKVPGRMFGTKKELVEEGRSKLRREQLCNFELLLKYIGVCKWKGGRDGWDMWHAWRSSEMSAGFTHTLTHSLTHSLTPPLYGPLNSLGLLNIWRLYFPVNCLPSPFLALHFPQILLHIFYPSHSRSFTSSNPLRFIPKYFNSPSLIHSCYMSDPFQYLPLCLDPYVAPSVPDNFLISTLLALPLVHVS